MTDQGMDRPGDKPEDVPETPPDGVLEFNYHLDDAPEKVWRAITRPEYRQSWLPDADLAEPEPCVVTPGEEVRYRMREDTPPFRTSDVTFRIIADPAGGTHLRITHELPAIRAAANCNNPAMMRAAA